MKRRYIKNLFKNILVDLAVYKYQVLQMKIKISECVSKYCIDIYKQYKEDKELRLKFDDLNQESSEDFRSDSKNDFSSMSPIKRHEFSPAKKLKKIVSQNA